VDLAASHEPTQGMFRNQMILSERSANKSCPMWAVIRTAVYDASVNVFCGGTENKDGKSIRSDVVLKALSSKNVPPQGMEINIREKNIHDALEFNACTGLHTDFRTFSQAVMSNAVVKPQDIPMSFLLSVQPGSYYCFFVLALQQLLVGYICRDIGESPEWSIRTFGSWRYRIFHRIAELNTG